MLRECFLPLLVKGQKEMFQVHAAISPKGEDLVNHQMVNSAAFNRQMSELRLIRKANLKKACDARGLKGPELARLVGDVGGSKSASYWADMLNQTNKKSFGEEPARAVERALRLPIYSMDQDGDTHGSNAPLDVKSDSPQSGSPGAVPDSEQFTMMSLTQQEIGFVELIRQVRSEDKVRIAAAIDTILDGYQADRMAARAKVNEEVESNRPFVRRSGNAA